MRTHSEPDCWYGDICGRALVAAKWNVAGVIGVAVPPPEPLLWIVAARDGVRVAGTGQRTGTVLEWDGSVWQPRGPSAGLHAVIYDKDDELVTVPRDGTITGSLGWRYVDDAGLLVRAIDTYDPSQILGRKFGVRDLWEFVEHGGILVGQGEHGIVAVVDGHRKRIDHLFTSSNPYCYAVRFHKSGSDLAIAYYNALPYVARFVWLTVDELRALPDEQAAPVPPQPIPQPQPEPVPMPNPVMSMPQDVYDTYCGVVAKFPHDGDDENRRAQNWKAVATVRARHGGNWATKTEHANLQAAGKDSLVYVPGTPQHGVKQGMYIWDMINGSTRQPVPRHNSEGYRETYTLLPEPHDWLQDAPQPPQPQQPPSDLPEKVAALTARVVELEAAVNLASETARQAKATADEALAHAGVPPSKTFTTTAGGGGWWGRAHTHDVTVTYP